MRLLCNGVALDLEAGATMSFKKTNPLFAFDELTCERTQAFSLPATPTNDRVLELAKIPAYYGAGMRRRFDAELQDGTVVKRGYLYVDKYESGKYSAVFVTGELVGLQDIKNLGKLADIIQCQEFVTYGRTFAEIEKLPQHANETWGIVAYVKNGALSPSSRVMDIVDRVVSATGIQVAYPRTFGGGLRVIVGAPKGLQPTDGQISRNWVRDFVEQSTVTIYPVVNTTIIDSTQTDLSALFGTDDTQIIQYITGHSSNGQLFRYTYKGRVQHIVAKQALTFTFASNWPSNLYVGRFVTDTSEISAFEFLGGRSFTKATGGRVTRYGDELKGRDIKLERGEKITIIDESDFYNDQQSGTPQNPWTIGWKFHRTSKRGGANMQGGDIDSGDVVRMQDNLPDVTFVELLKVVAAATGFLLNYTDEDGITFDNLNLNTWPIIDVTNNVTKIGELSRKFGDYVRNNIVEYNSDASVPEVMRLRAIYQIDNDNLDDVTVLQTLPFSEGKTTTYDGMAVLSVADENQADVLGDTRTTTKAMVNVIPNKNANLQALCDASTSLTVSVRMTLAEYEALGSKVRLLYAGTLYVWTEAQYSKGVVTLKLSKIPA